MKPLLTYRRLRHPDSKEIHYVDEHDCDHDDLTEFLQCGILGFCLCGRPEDILEFIYHLLKLNMQWTNEEIDYDLYRKTKTKFFADNIETVEWFFDYFLDKKGITEHGGNVSGWFVNDDNFVDAIETWYRTERIV